MKVSRYLPLSGIDPILTTCYKEQFCTGSFRSRYNPSEAASCKIRRGQAQHSVVGFAVEACSEFRRFFLAYAAQACSDAGCSAGRLYLNTFVYS
jgi:hypothetical protein